MQSGKLLIMNFKNENIGYVERTEAAFIQCLNGEITEHSTLPRIMCGIAPEPTQFPAMNGDLGYFNMTRFDLWTYFARSNGIKSSRDIWFMSEPPGEVWIPLVAGMQRYQTYDALFKTGDTLKVLMNGRAYVNRHQADLFPEVIKPYLKQVGDTWFSTADGYIKDISPYVSVRGLIGRVVLNFPL
jgi:hypothetical protein